MRSIAFAIAMFVSPLAFGQELTIGVPMALTGPYAFVGVPITNGVQLAAEQANAKGGIHGAKLKLLVQDDASDKAQVITLVTRMAVADKVLMIVGPTSTIEATAAAPVANDKEVPLITSAVSPEVRKAGKWSFNVTAPPASIMKVLGEYVPAKLGVKRAATIVVRDNEGFINQKNVVRDTVRANGVEIVSEETIAGTDSDFTALGTKLASQKIDALMIFMPAEQGANLVIQAKQAGLPASVKIVAPPGMVSEAYIKTGGGAIEVTTLVADYFSGDPSPLNQSFVEAYRKKHGTTPDNWAGVGFTLMQVALKALEAAGPNPDRVKVRDALEGVRDMPTVLGQGRYSLKEGDREPTYGAAILTVRGGKFELAAQ